MDRLGSDILSVLRMKGQVLKRDFSCLQQRGKKCDNYWTKLWSNAIELGFEEIYRYEIEIRIIQKETGKKCQNRISIFLENCKKLTNNKHPEVKKLLNQKKYKQITRRSSLYRNHTQWRKVSQDLSKVIKAQKLSFGCLIKNVHGLWQLICFHWALLFIGAWEAIQIKIKRIYWRSFCVFYITSRISPSMPLFS